MLPEGKLEGAAERRPLYRTPDIDFVMRHRNEGATEDLIIPVHLVCNTPDEILHDHIRANSLASREWVGTEKAHDGVAILVGGGPSLEQYIGLIDAMHASGATIFALNGAAGYLAGKGIYADYQVIVDAREQTKDLIGPAKHHVFASQVHPVLFQRVPDAMVAHVNPHADFNDFLALLPDYHREFALLGSHGSVGNVAMALAYTMGFRNINCFGYDSSHKEGHGHAYEQPMNDLEPMVKTELNGKTYYSTFTMKAQANVFPRLAYDLEDLGCKVFLHGSGLLPDKWNGDKLKSPEQREEEKYTEMWTHPEYRDMSPAYDLVDTAVVKLGLRAGDNLTDFGCGSGRATKYIQNLGVDVVGVDIAENALEVDVPFVKAILWDLPGYIYSDYGLCCDVMEHIPTDKVDDVLRNIAKCVERGVYFRIDFVPDEMGHLIGAPLHLTVRSREWWVARLERVFARVEGSGNEFVCWHVLSEQANSKA